MKNQLIGLMSRCYRQFNNFKNQQNGVAALEYAVVAAGLTLIFLSVFYLDGPFHHAMENMLKGSTDGILAALSNIL